MEKQANGNVGLYLAAAKLSEMGLVVSPANGGKGGVDLLILDPVSGRTTALQVKIVGNRHNSVIVTVGHQNKIDDLPLLYNLLIIKKNNGGYSFYVVPKGDLRILMREAWKRFLEEGDHRRPINPNSVRPLIIYVGQLKQYEDKWEYIWGNGRRST